MPYIGRGLTTGAQYQKLDAIAINNATTFTMSVGSANVSPDQNHLILVVNGVIQEPGTGFTVAGSTCTLASAITTSGHSGTDTIYGVIAGDAAFAAYDSIGVNALGVTAGTVTASRAVVPDSNKDIASFRNVTLTGELDAATLDISGNADIDGTTNLDAVDIDGAVQIDSTVTVGVDDTGYDVKFFGATSGAYMLWDESADDLVLAGAAGIDLEGDIDVNGTANLDVVDIDGAVDMASTLTIADDILIAENIKHTGDTDTRIRMLNDNVIIYAGNENQLDIGNVITVFNEDGGDNDLRIESENNANMFYVDASTDRIGIGTASPAGLLEVENSSGDCNVYITAENASNSRLYFGDQADVGAGFVDYDHDGNTMKLGTNGTTRLTVGTDLFYFNGLIGVGHDSPQFGLTLAQGDTDATAIGWEDGSNNKRASIYCGTSDDSLRFHVNGADRGRFETDGLFVAKTGIRLDGSVLSGSETGIGSSGNGGDLLLYSNGSAHARLNSNGALLVGDTAQTDGELFKVHGTTDAKYLVRIHQTNTAIASDDLIMQMAFDNDASTTAGARFIVFEDSNTTMGSIAVATNVDQIVYNTTSDKRLKENIKDASSQLKTINDIQVREFKWKRNGYEDIGVIAQELEKVYPKAVTKGGDDVSEKPYEVDYSTLVIPLIKAVQELSLQNDALTARIEALEA